MSKLARHQDTIRQERATTREKGYLGNPFDLERFVRAQTPVFDTALTELKTGRKRSH